jgi:NAD(P)-dependent dehydrogenase (short-subunit alcohol dehydrogenase family)
MVITGGSSGIGQALVQKFLKFDYRVTLTYNYNVPQIHHPLVNAIKVDLKNEQELANFRANLDCQNIDVLINNAAFSKKTEFSKITENELREVLEVNLVAAFRILQTTFDVMKKQKYGKIINVGSIGGQIGGRDQIHYAVSKGALETLIKSIALIGFDENIYAYNISPGCVDTKMLRSLHDDYSNLKSKIPFGDIAKAQDLAELVFSICAPEWNYASGQTINYNGGLLL